MSFLDSLFGGGGNHIDMTPITNAYNSRLGQINDFSNKLASARNSYLASAQNLSNTAFNQYWQNAQAQMAGRGLSTNSGAFSSALARESAMLGGQMATNAWQSDMGNAGAVNNAYARAYGTYAPELMNGQLFNANIDNQNAQALGNLVGTVGGAAMGTWMGGAPAGSFMSRFAGNLGYGMGAGMYGNPGPYANAGMFNSPMPSWAGSGASDPLGLNGGRNSRTSVGLW